MSLIWFDPFVWPFHAFVTAHIFTGAAGALAFWVPIAARKGAAVHRWAGRVFTVCLLVTGVIAVCMSVCTLLDPVTTHPHVHESAALISGIFGWMMLYLGVLTINLTWYGWLCILQRRSRAAMRGPVNLALQGLLLAAAANCLWQGAQIGQVLMIGISMVGFATVATNLWYLYKPSPGPIDWQLEHIKALVGAGISVYTAFFAFGAVRLMPELALNPAFWSIPLVTGLILIVYHQQRLLRRLRRPVGGASAAVAGAPTTNAVPPLAR
jgi:hypothetical protein